MVYATGFIEINEASHHAYALSDNSESPNGQTRMVVAVTGSASAERKLATQNTKKT